MTVKENRPHAICSHSISMIGVDHRSLPRDVVFCPRMRRLLLSLSERGPCASPLVR